MKRTSRLFFFAMLTIAMLLVSACGSTTQSTDGGSAKPLPSLVPVSGVIEAINGNQWTIDGKVVIVDLSMLGDDDDLSDYQVGDYVEIQAEEQADGSLVAHKVNSSDSGNENDALNSNDGFSNSQDDDSSNSNDDDSSNGNEDDDDFNGNDDDDSNDNDDQSESDSNDNDDDNSGDDSSNSNDNDDSGDDDDNDD